MVIQCGRQFTVNVVQAPVFKKNTFQKTASGQYLVIQIEIVNLTNRTWSHMTDESYLVTGKNGSNRVTYTPDWDVSWHEAYRLGLKTYSLDEVPPNVTWKTAVGFDVNPEDTDWVFVFQPAPTAFDNAVCKVQIPLRASSTTTSSGPNPTAAPNTEGGCAPTTALWVLSTLEQLTDWTFEDILGWIDGVRSTESSYSAIMNNVARLDTWENWPLCGESARAATLTFMQAGAAYVASGADPAAKAAFETAQAAMKAEIEKINR
jgi:hypothetical protein